jgi:hypothetical protein
MTDANVALLHPSPSPVAGEGHTARGAKLRSKKDPTAALRVRRHRNKRKASAASGPQAPSADKKSASDVKPVLTASPARVRSVSLARSFRRHAPATGLGAVILVLLYLSLSHLARGIVIVTGCEAWEGTAMAIGLDLLIVALECAMVATVGTQAYKPVARFANPALIVAFLVGRAQCLRVLCIVEQRAVDDRDGRGVGRLDTRINLRGHPCLGGTRDQCAGVDRMGFVPRNGQRAAYGPPFSLPPVGDAPRDTFRAKWRARTVAPPHKGGSCAPRPSVPPGI